MKVFITIVVLFFANIGFASVAYAQSDQDDALRAVQSGEIMSYGQIRKLTETALGGTVIGQEPPRKQGKRWVYSLRVLQFSGQVVMVEVDARNGKVLKSRGKR